MKASELFQEMSPATASSIFQYLRDEQREVYSASLSSLAQNRKLRPVFIQRKPASQQIDWLVKNAKLRGSNEIGEHVLQLWLMKGHQEMLTAFLDGVGIEHDGEGAAEDLPDKLDPKKLKKTVDSLLTKHDPEVVAIYLQIFQAQKPEGWEALDELIAATPQLQLGAPPEDEAPAEQETESEDGDDTDSESATDVSEK
ncbi:MAG: hypothetical protein AAF236_17035 [Verrucomicrobiota bacterium]